MKDALLDHLVGRWEVSGRVGGGSAAQTCDAEWVLNHQFLRLHLLAVEPTEDTEGGGSTRYEALVFYGYSHTLDRYVVHWIDVFGGHFSRDLGLGVRNKKGDAVVVEFGKDRSLRNTMTWSSEDQTWSMLIQQRDAERKWATFADTRFTRVVGGRTVD